MLSFRNPGLMDLTAATTFGVSVKESDNPIGFFGTGFKYAVAIVLRLGGRVKLWVGEEGHEFTAQRQTIRGEEFDIVHMDGKPLGFTTRMGINWEPWQAFRELYCNALDEGGTVVEGNLEPQPGCTTVHVTKLDEQYYARNQIVLPKTLVPVYEDEGMRIYPGPASHAYYRGVRVMELLKKSEFLYNIIAPMTLTEDRTLRNSWDFQRTMAQTVCAATNKDVIRSIVTAHRASFEHDLDLNWGDIAPSQEFLDVVAVVRRQADVTLNMSAQRVYSKYRTDPVQIEQITLNEIEAEQLKRALTFLADIGHVIDPASVRIVDSLGEGVYGKALVSENVILISRRTFQVGTKYVAGTLMEEHLHIKHKFADCSREFQNYLIDQVVTVGERFVGRPL